MVESVLDGALRQALKRDWALVVFAIAALTVFAWVYLVWIAVGMSDAPAVGGMAMDGMAMEGMSMAAPAFRSWSAADVGFAFSMWAVMMVGMMAPATAPMILLYARVARQATDRGQPFAAASWFAAGYFLVWFGFSAIATLAQWLLERAALLTPMMASNSDLLGGLVLVTAGVYQWTPLKNACLTVCRSPLGFIQRHGGFQAGRLASLRLGGRHGVYCLGCCWALMALLFVGGVMNLLWIAGLALFVLLEKGVMRGPWPSRIVGAAAILAGVVLLARGSSR